MSFYITIYLPSQLPLSRHQNRMMLLQIRFPSTNITKPTTCRIIPQAFIVYQRQFQCSRPKVTVTRMPISQISSVRVTLQMLRTNALICFVTATPLTLNIMKVSIPRITNDSSRWDEPIALKQDRGLSMNALPWESQAQALTSKEQGIKLRQVIMSDWVINPTTPSYPTISRGSTWQLVKRVCSQVNWKPSQINERIIIKQPSSCMTYYILSLTNSSSVADLPAKRMAEMPTMATPMNASPLPMIWYSQALISRKISENINVVTIDPPCNIWQTDPEIKLRANSCRLEARQSQKAGTANLRMLNSRDLPSSLAFYALRAQESELVFLWKQQTARASISPRNMAATCVGREQPA